MWADVPLYGFSEDDFATRLQAVQQCLDSSLAPCAAKQSRLILGDKCHS